MRYSHLALSIVAFSVNVLPCALAETITPIKAADAHASIGITTHLNYLDGAYAKVPKVIESLKFLGISHVREMTPSPWLGGAPPITAYTDLMGAGITVNFVAHSGEFNGERILSQLVELEQLRPGKITAVEGFNEVDHTPVTLNGQGGADGAIAAQKAFFTSVKAHKRLKHLPVYDLTGTSLPTDLSGRADFANAHLYPQNGYPPGPWFKGMRDLARPSAWPMVITEFGYASNVESGWLVIGVGPEGQAKGVVSGMFSSFENGFSKLYLYQLLDEKPDPEFKSREWHFGLFDNNYKPKPAAMAVRNVMHLIKDGGGANFTPRPFDIDLSDLPETARWVALEKSDGSILLALWDEQVFWDRETGKPITHAPVRVSLKLSEGLNTVALYDPLRSPEAIKPDNLNKDVDFELRDYPQILVLKRKN